MAFAVICKSCQARFLLNDDLLRRKVAGKVVTVRCRQCHATIEVDASEVDPKTLPEVEEPVPSPKLPPKGLKPAPPPPRPTAKSTLMGIGGPPKPGAATELIALSPGLLNMSPPSADAELGFPEPPPPPGAVIEELNAADWEVTETPPLVKSDAEATPESVDEFIEELPPSLPLAEEDVPSSTGTPSLKALTHHDEHVAQPRSDDFLANMSAAMNGGMMGDTVSDGAPTIDISTLAATPVERASAPSIDVSELDLPSDGKKTLPLFALGSDADAGTGRRATPTQPVTLARPSEGSLSPAALDQPRDSERSEGARERKNVVSPGSQPLAAAQRRSGLAAPVLLALAIAAGFLIWKRSGAHDDLAVRSEAPAAHPVTTPPAANTPAAPPEAAAPAAVTLAPAPTAADDVTFETTPTKPAVVPAATRDKPTSAETPTAGEKPGPAAPTEPKPEPPVAKEEPKTPIEPAVPGEPAGPFDRAAAATALTASAAQASACRKEGDPSGVASVVITFAPSGRVTSANISGPPFAGTATGGCIANALRKAHVPAFDGERVTVSKTIVIQ